MSMFWLCIIIGSCRFRHLQTIESASLTCRTHVHPSYSLLCAFPSPDDQPSLSISRLRLRSRDQRSLCARVKSRANRTEMAALCRNPARRVNINMTTRSCQIQVLTMLQGVVTLIQRCRRVSSPEHTLTY